MPLTPEEEAEFQSLSAEFDRPSLLSRFGAASANAVFSIPNTITEGTTNLVNMVTGTVGIPKISPGDAVIPDPFNIPRPRDWTEVGAEVVPNIAAAVGSFAIPGAALTKGAAALGAAPRLASLLGAIGSGGIFGAATSPEEAGVQGGIAGVQEAASFLPRQARIPLSAIAGVGAGMDAYSQGASPGAAIGIGAAQALLPFLPKQRLFPTNLKIDEIIPPTPQVKPKRMRSDVIVEDMNPYPPTPVGREMVPVNGQNADNLAFDHMLYNVQLADEVSRVPFTMKDGQIVPTYEARKLLPWHEQPSVADEVVATLQSPNEFKDSSGRVFVREAMSDDNGIVYKAAEENNATFDRYDPETKKFQLTLNDNGTTVYVPKNATANEVAEILANKRTEFNQPNVVESVEDLDAFLRKMGALPKVEPTIPKIPEATPPTKSLVKQPTMRDLKKLAKQMGVEIEDDINNATIQLHAPEGHAWEQGSLSSMVSSYGSKGSYLPAWRNEGIKDAYERLLNNPPEKIATAEIVTQKKRIPEANPPPPPKPELTRGQRQAVAMAFGKATKGGKEITEAERAAIVERIANPAAPKSRAKPLDVDKYTEGNSLRVVPGEGKGGIAFETLRDVAPGAGKLKFTVPEGTSHAEANKLYKAKKAELIATLQQEKATTKPTVPFSDVSSADISDADLRRMGLDVSNLGTESETVGLRKLRSAIGGGTYMDILTKFSAPAIGGAVGGALDEENRARGIVLGMIAGGLASKYGTKAIQALIQSDHKSLKLLLKGRVGLEDLAAKSTFRGQGDVYSKSARWFEKNFGSNEDIKRAQAIGVGHQHYLGRMWNDALTVLRRKWDTLPPAVQDAIDAYGTADPISVTPALRNLQAATTDPEVIAAVVLERSTRQMAHVETLEGLNPKDPMYQTISDRNGTYQRRVYEIHFNKDYLPKEQDVENTIQEFRLIASGPGGMLSSNLMDENIARATVYNYIHDTLVERGMRGVPDKYAPSKGKETLSEVLRKRLPQLEGRPAFRAMMGEVTEPLKVRAATAMKLMQAVQSAQYFKEIAKSTTPRGNKFALTATEWPAEIHNLEQRIAAATNPDVVATLQSQLDELKHYVPTGSNPGLGILADKYVHRQVRDRLPGNDGVFEGNFGPIFDSMARINNLAKQAKVGANPLSWWRAHLSIPFHMALGRANFATDLPRAVKAMRPTSKLYKELMQQGIMSGGYGTGEVRKDLGIMLNPKLTEEGLSKAWYSWVNFGAERMDYADNVARVAIYLAAKDRFARELVHDPASGRMVSKYSPEQQKKKATDWTNRYAMNYSVVAPGIRKMRQMPFVNQFLTYSSEMSRITKNLLDDIVRNTNGNRWHAIAAMAGISGLFFGAQYLAEGMLSKEEQKEWDAIKKMLPAYKRYGFLIPKQKNKDGTFTYYNVSPLFIADDIAKVIRAIGNGDWEGLKAVNPIIGWDNSPAFTIVNAAAGKDLRTDRKLYDWGDRLDVMRKEVLPPLLGGYEMDNFVNSLTPNAEGKLGIFNQKTGQRFYVSDLITSYMTGVRRTDTRYEVLLERVAQNAQDQVRAIESDMRRDAQLNLSRAELEHRLEMNQRKIKTVIEELQRKVNYGEFEPAK